MCWFITVGVGRAVRETFENIAKAHSLQLTHLSRTPTTGVFPAGASCIEVTQGGCSCNLYSASPKPGQAEVQLARARQRMERMGWSSSKIQRALDAKSTAESRAGSSRESADVFKRFVAEVVAACGSVDLFAHFYSGSQHEQDVGSPDAAALSLRNFLEDGFPPDTVTTVRP